MTKVVVNPGACGFIATISVWKTAKRKVGIEIISDCEMISRMGESSTELDPFDALKQHPDSSIYQAANRCELHPSCPVPVAVIKAIEVEGDLALPRDVVIHFDSAE